MFYLYASLNILYFYSCMCSAAAAMAFIVAAFSEWGRGGLCLTVLLLICAPAIIVFSMENIAAWLKTQSFSSCTLRQQVVFFFNSLRIFTKKAKNILRFQIPHCKKKEQNIFLKKIYYRNLSSLKITEEEKIQKRK